MFLFLMTSVRLCCLIAPWSRRFPLYWDTNTTARYSDALSCHWDHWERKHITGNTLNRYMSTWGIVLILFAVLSYPSHQLPKNTASFVILCCYIVSLVHQICSSAVISTPQINLFHKNPCDHSIPYPFHFLPISDSSVFNLASRSSHFDSRKKTATLMLIQKIKRAPLWLFLHWLYI